MDNYPGTSLDLQRMNRALRHRLRNLCAGVKMTMERMAASDPKLTDRCSLICSEMDSIQRMTDRMDLLFDTLPQASVSSLFDILSSLRDMFVKTYPFCSLELDGPDIAASIPKGSWLRIALTELLLNAGEAAGSDGHTSISWRISKDASLIIEIVNGGHPVPPDIPLSPPEPFHTPRSRHDGIGLSIAWRICNDANFRLELSRDEKNDLTKVKIDIPPGEFHGHPAKA